MKPHNGPQVADFDKFLRELGDDIDLCTADFYWLYDHMFFFGDVNQDGVLSVLEFKSGVKQLQQWADLQYPLPVDGIANAKLVTRLQRMVRCKEPALERAKMAAAGKWGLDRIFYHRQDAVDGITPNRQDEILELLTDLVHRVCALEIEPTTIASRADIVIRVSGDRRLGFGCAGGTLGSTQLPPTDHWGRNMSTAESQLSCDLDETEPWTEKMYGRVVLHEAFGHALGKRHTHQTTERSVMEPWLWDYTDYTAHDVKWLQKMYGEP